MPHLRQRIALKRLKQKLNFSRVVSIQGARQTGKSVLARDLLANKTYVTLDDASTREEAKSRTSYFLEELRQQNEDFTIVIDEAQKAPVLFDQIKTIVDLNSSPGQFLL